MAVEQVLTLLLQLELLEELTQVQVVVVVLVLVTQQALAAQVLSLLDMRTREK